MDRNTLSAKMHKTSSTLILLLLGIFLPSWARAQSLYADPKAGREGDVVTVVLVERTAAQQESRWQNRANSKLGTAAEVGGGTLTGRFAADASFNKEALARNESMQSDLLQGRMSALVVGVEPTGNLVVQGQRKINVNGEGHMLSVSGIVRPQDVRYDNTVLSHEIANAVIEYRRTGFGRKFFKPGAFARIGVIAALGAAILLSAD